MNPLPRTSAVPFFAAALVAILLFSPLPGQVLRYQWKVGDTWVMSDSRPSSPGAPPFVSYEHFEVLDRLAERFLVLQTDFRRDPKSRALLRESVALHVVDERGRDGATRTSAPHTLHTQALGPRLPKQRARRGHKWLDEVQGFGIVFENELLRRTGEDKKHKRYAIESQYRSPSSELVYRPRLVSNRYLFDKGLGRCVGYTMSNGQRSDPVTGDAALEMTAIATNLADMIAEYSDGWRSGRYTDNADERLKHLELINKEVIEGAAIRTAAPAVLESPVVLDLIEFYEPEQLPAPALDVPKDFLSKECRAFWNKLRVRGKITVIHTFAHSQRGSWFGIDPAADLAKAPPRRVAVRFLAIDGQEQLTETLKCIGLKKPDVVDAMRVLGRKGARIADQIPAGVTIVLDLKGQVRTVSPHFKSPQGGLQPTPAFRYGRMLERFIEAVR